MTFQTINDLFKGMFTTNSLGDTAVRMVGTSGDTPTQFFINDATRDVETSTEAGEKAIRNVSKEA